jgi:hypothetical protein
MLTSLRIDSLHTVLEFFCMKDVHCRYIGRLDALKK